MSTQAAVLQIRLPGNQTEELAGGSTASDLAKRIKKELKGVPLFARINGKMRDLNTALASEDEVEILTFEDADGRQGFWHSSAHLLAQAVLRLFPDAQPTIGPAIENGFFYDFANLQVSEEDFPRIEEEMRKIVKEHIAPERIEYANMAEAKAQFRSNPFKTDLIEKHEESLSAYRQGDFVDLCTGPHIPNTSVVQAFKVMKTSGAYWRGDSNNAQLTRVYAISFPDKKQLSQYLHVLEEAKKRDHRVLGKKLDLFSFHEEAPGMPFIHPRGMAIWDELLRFEKELQRAAEYVEIKTPVMLARELWETSGHWDYYREHMYTSKVDEREFAIKPMNCPGCMLFYKYSQYSFRQLPLRVAETGLVHRHELSGALSGMFRVRSFHQDDAHIFMQAEDLKSEILGVLALAEKVYGTLGLDYHLELSTRPDKSIGTDAAWEMATKGLKDALDEGGYVYRINEGDGAFYGPKIDMHIKDVIGRTWQCGTIQLDMNLPERFGLHYEASEGERKQPIMIHRVLYGSIERFFGILIEHFGGRFPLWLSPVQAAVLTVADRHEQSARAIVSQMRDSGLRVDLDHSSESVPKKVRNAQLDQANYILVVGDQEIESGKLAVRTREGKLLEAVLLADLIASMQKEASERSLDPTLA